MGESCTSTKQWRTHIRLGIFYNATRFFETVRFDIEPQKIRVSAFLRSNIIELPPMLKLDEIHDQAFYANSELDTLGEMPLLRKINLCAFDGCESLEHLPSTLNNLEEIGDGAFRGCGKLKNLPNMPKLTHIHNQAFRDCIELKTFHLSGSIRHIVNRAFYNCPNLEVTIEPGVSFEELVCNDLKIREAFQQAGLEEPKSDDDLEENYDLSGGDPTYNPYNLEIREYSI